jgi:hypothetical protein
MSKKTWTNTMSTYFAQGMQYALKYGAWCYTEFELPEVGQRVMIVSQRPNGYRDIRIANLFECRNEETGETSLQWTNSIKNETVTHWMPTPQLPQI